MGIALNCFSKKGFNVKSFGTGDKVKLPGNAPDRPNIYDFGTSYDEIYNDLLSKDKQLYPKRQMNNNFLFQVGTVGSDSFKEKIISNGAGTIRII